MKIICSKEELLNGLKITQPIVGTKSTLPVLSNILFETEGTKVKLSATDLEIGVACYIKAEVVEEGSITIPAQRLMDIVREIPDTNIEMNVTKDNIKIVANKSKFNLVGIAKKDFPNLPEYDKTATFTVKRADLITMFKKTIFSTSKDLQRYALNGIYFVAEENKIKAVSTDGKRLSFIERDIDKEFIAINSPIKVIIPNKAIADFLKLFSALAVDNMQVSVSNNLITFIVGEILFQSRLIEGNFPNYEQVMPKGETSKVKLNTFETLSAIKQAALIANGNMATGGISVIKITFENNKMIVAAETSNVGSGEIEVDIEYSLPNITINFNPNFLKEVLQNVEEESFMFSFTKKESPITIVPIKDNKYVCVVMPIRN